MSGSGHGKNVGSWLVWALMMGCAALARADAADTPARAVCIDPHDTELKARIEGQTRDLTIDLRWLDEPLAADPQDSELKRVADGQGAQFVVVVQPSPQGGLRVFVYAATSGKLRTRDVPRPVGAARLAASALAETAALIVRGELSAALSGETQNTQLPAQVVQPASRPTSAAAVSSKSPSHDSRVSESAVRPSAGLSLAAGVRAGLVADHHMLAGPWLAMYLGVAHFALGISASTTLPSDLQREHVRITLRRHALGLSFLGRLAFGPHFELAAGISAGLALHPRQTRLELNSGLQQTAASTSWAATLGPLLSLRWRVVERAGLALQLGLDINAQPTRFVYDDVATAHGSVQLARLNTLEPWGLAALFVELGR